MLLTLLQDERDQDPPGSQLDPGFEIMQRSST